MRETWIDQWKGVLIVLVILGHAIGVAGHFAQGLTKEILDLGFKAIYCFHMPAFFCVVGYVWRTREDELFGTFCKKKFRRLIVPYLIFCLLGGIVYYWASGAFNSVVCSVTDDYYARIGETPTVVGLLLSVVHAGGWPDNGVFRGNSVLWFLPAMFTVCVMYKCLDLWVRDKRIQLVLALLSLIWSFYVPEGLPWGLSTALYYLPFVIVGRWILPRFVSCLGNNTWLVFLLSLVYLFVCWITPNAYCRNIHLTWRLGFFAIATLGCLVSASVTIKINVRILANFGLSSLGIMLLHKYVILTVGMKVPYVRSLYACTTPVAIGVVVALTILAVMASYGLTKIIERYRPEFLGGWRK